MFIISGANSLCHMTGTVRLQAVSDSHKLTTSLVLNDKLKLILTCIKSIGIIL